MLVLHGPQPRPHPPLLTLQRRPDVPRLGKVSVSTGSQTLLVLSGPVTRGLFSLTVGVGRKTRVVTCQGPETGFDTRDWRGTTTSTLPVYNL